jgi:hypothetical protein
MVELVTVGWISPRRCFGLAEWMAAVTSRFLPAEPSSRRPYRIGFFRKAESTFRKNPMR